MAHPFASKRADKVGMERARKFAGAHSDVAEDRALIRESVKASALKRARGGRAGKVDININVGGAPGGPPSGPLPPPTLGAPIKPPVPPVPSAPSVPPGLPPQLGPNPLMRAKGGRIKPGPGWIESERLKTPVQHTDGKLDQKNVGRKQVVTYATGGRIESENAPMGPKLPGGAMGGLARLAKARMARGR